MKQKGAYIISGFGKGWLSRRGFSVIEYVFLVTLILVVLVVFRVYILHGFGGKYKSIGEAFGFGRQFEQGKTMTCGYDDRIDAWYDEACFDNERYKCAAGDRDCELKIIKDVCLKSSKQCN